MKTSLSFLLFTLCLTEVPEDQNLIQVVWIPSTPQLSASSSPYPYAALEKGEGDLDLAGDNV